jgi:hypothetical protein
MINTVQWLEPINRIHFAKSYVRKPFWSDSSKAGPLTLSKGFHDFDWILGGEDAEILSSAGQKHQFNPEMQPSQANGAKYCTKCPIKESCDFSAIQNYGTHERYRKYVTDIPNPIKEDAIRDLEDGPYDRCFYQSNSDLSDDYSIIMKVYNKSSSCLVSLVFSALHDDICWKPASIVGTATTLELSTDQSYFSHKSGWFEWWC